MYYRREYYFHNGINAVTVKASPNDKYTIRFEDCTNGNKCSLTCESRVSLYHALKSGVDFLKRQRRAILESNG